MDVLAVTKDPGGTAGVLPVVPELRRLGLTVDVLANGKAVEILYDQGEFFAACKSADRVIATIEIPRLLLTSMCSGGGVGRDLISLYRERFPGIRKPISVALTDYWGTKALKDLWRDARHRPDYVCVNDALGMSLVKDAWEDFPSGHIKVCGYPALDKYVDYDMTLASDRVRNTLNLHDKRPIILFCGDTQRTTSVLSEVIAALDALRRDAYFIPRAHPRFHEESRDEAIEWDRILNVSGMSHATLIRSSSECDMASLIAASSVVLASYSTVLVEAAALRKSVIAVLYPDTMEMYRELVGLWEFPLVSLGCCARATNRDELCGFLKSVLDGGDLGLRESQEKIFRLDGQNARRVANFIDSQLKGL